MESEELANCYGKHCLHCETPCELQSCGINVIREKQHEIALRFGKRDEMVADEVYVDDMCDSRKGGPDDYMDDFLAAVEHEDPTEEELLKQVKLDTLRHILHYWAEKPTCLEAMFRRYLLGQNQSDMARIRGVTRQNVSKIIKTERREIFQKQIHDLQERLDTMEKLSPEEIAIYRSCMQDGCSIRSTAKQLHLSPARVYRVKQSLRRKMAKSETLLTPQNKKNQKIFKKNKAQ